MWSKQDETDSSVLQRYGLDALLASTALTSEGGIRAVTEQGDSCIDVDALYRVIESRYALQRRRGTGIVVNSDLFCTH